MALLFGGVANAIFSDTGWEHKSMYDRLDYVESQIQAIHPSFKIIRIKNEKHDSLQQYISDTKFFPSQIARFCTRMFKIEPIDNYLRGQGDIELMIGLNADESDRAGNHGLVNNITYSYPLLDNGITRKVCIGLLTKANLLPDLPPYMMRGGCIGCFYKTKKEYIAMRLLNPVEFDMVESLEREIQDKRGNHYSVQAGRFKMSDIRIEADRAMFSAEEMYSTNNNHSSPCGVFCHR